MTKTVRKIIFYIFAAAFAIVAPAVVLYTSGYRFNWKKQQVQKTGVLQVDSDPHRADVFLNGGPTGETTPATFSRLTPEEYDVRIEREGYLPWRKTLAVRSGETVSANTVLFRDALPELIAKSDIVAADYWYNRLAAFVKVNGSVELHFFGFPDDSFSIAGATVTDELIPQLRFPDASGTTFSVAMTDGGILATIAAKNETQLWLVRWDRGQLQTVRLDKKIPRFQKDAALGGVRVRWLRPQGTAVLVVTPRNVSIIDTTIGTTAFVARQLLTDRQIVDAAVSGATKSTQGNDLFVAERVAETVVITKRDITSRGDAQKIATLEDADYRFEAFGSNDIAAIDDRRQRAFLLGNASLMEIPITHLTTDDDESGGILCWNDFELYLLDPKTSIATLLTRLAWPISGALHHPKGANVIVYGDEGIVAVELDDRNGRQIIPLSALRDVRDLAITDEKEPVLRFIGTAGNQRGIYERALQ